MNPRDADAYSWLGEIRGVLGVGEPAGLVLRAVSLEPHEAVHRLRAAFVLARQRKFDEAAVHARAGEALATTDAERRRAQELFDLIAKAKEAGGTFRLKAEATKTYIAPSGLPRRSAKPG